MNYCLSAQVGSEYMAKAQEIRVKYKYLDTLLDIYEINPEASIVLTISSKEDKSKIRWEEIEKYNKMWQNKVIIETDSFDIMDACKALGLKFFYAIPINTFYELKALADYGCCDVKIDAPLTHMLDKIENFDITIRMCPNIAYYSYIPRENGVIGSWVRPEDVEAYESYIDVFEFEDCDAKKERALYRVYAEQKSWLGPLNGLISNLNYPGDSKLVPEDFGIIRRFCGQRCTDGMNCSVCYRILDMAQPEKVRKIFDKVVQ
jgi:hypothetical protein